MTKDNTKLREALADFQHRTNYYNDFAAHSYRWEVRTPDKGDEGLLCTCGFHVRKEWLDETTKSIQSLVAEVIGEDETNLESSRVFWQKDLLALQRQRAKEGGLLP